MNIYHSFEEVGYDKNTVVTLGTFDGVHKGHQVIIKRLLEIAEKDNLRHLLMTFDPHPQIVLQKAGKEPIKLLTDINERIKILKRHGVQNILVVPFTLEFSKTSPESFVKDYIVKKLGMKKILIGYDHMFGNHREGDKSLLNTLSKELDFEVEKIGPYRFNETIISSTIIRHALKNCELELANEMLGYHYLANGYVTKGTQRGTKLGFPTANIAIPEKHKQMPGNGVYLVRVKIKTCEFYGMANIGIRPTFTDDNETRLEVHIFDFNDDIYMLEAFVRFLKYLRPEKKFSSSDELVNQLEKDKSQCLELINNF